MRGDRGVLSRELKRKLNYGPEIYKVIRGANYTCVGAKRKYYSNNNNNNCLPRAKEL